MGFYQGFLKLYLITKRNFKIYPLEELKEVPKKFLVFSITALGDTLFSTPAIKSLRFSFPKSEIIAVINHRWLPLFENFPYIDKLYGFKKGVFNIFALGKKLKKEEAELALIFHGNYPEDIVLCELSGVKFILKSRKNCEYLKYLSFTDFEVNTHAIETRLALVRALGGKEIVKEMEIGPLDDLNIKQKIDNILKLKNGTKIVGFQLGASYLAKAWPVENFVELAKLLTDKGNFVFVLTGSKKEIELGKKFEMLYPYNNFINLIGKLSIKELPYVLKKLDVLVTPDTGVLQLAIALKVPTVSLFVLTNPVYNGPFQDLNIHQVIFKEEGLKYTYLDKKKRPNEIMKFITPEEVLRKIEKVVRYENSFL